MGIEAMDPFWLGVLTVFAIEGIVAFLAICIGFFYVGVRIWL